MSDVDGPATGGSGGRVEPSASLKRKAHIPLDDVDRLHKERKITHPAARSKSGASAAASVSPSARRSLESIQADADASMQDHSASSFPDGVTTEELYRDRDADETAQRVDEGAGGEEVDPFDLGDAFDDIGGYEDDNFQDDE